LKGDIIISGHSLMCVRWKHKKKKNKLKDPVLVNVVFPPTNVKQITFNNHSNYKK